MSVIYLKGDERMWIRISDAVSEEDIFRGSVLDPGNEKWDLSIDDSADTDKDHCMIEEEGKAAYIYSKGQKDPWLTIHIDPKLDAFLKRNAEHNKVKPRATPKAKAKPKIRPEIQAKLDAVLAEMRSKRGI